MMIIKSSQRAGHRELATHLMKQRDLDGTPQVVTVSGSRDLMTGDNVFEALDDMALMAQASDRCQKDLYHVSLSPAAPMSEEEWAIAWDLYEQEFALTDLAYIEVTHEKGDHRENHKHRVYERVNTQTGRAVAISHSYARNELVSRLIEHRFGHELVIGKHNRSVIKRLQQEGEHAVVSWMEAGQAHRCDRPSAKQTHQDVQQQKRTKVLTEQVVQDLKDCFEHTDNGQAFESAIAEKGYVLARGDRRDFVVIDGEGAVHSPRRRIGVKAKVLRDKWADLDPQHLPTVAEVVQVIASLKISTMQDEETDDENAVANTVTNTGEEDTTDSSASDTGGFIHDASDNEADDQSDQTLAQLFAEELETQALITALEKELEAERLQEEVNYWQRQAEAELERTKPRPRVQRTHKTGRGRHPNLWQRVPLSDHQLVSLQGRDAIAERQSRLLALSQPITPMSGKALQSPRLATHGLTAMEGQGASAHQHQTDVMGLQEYQRGWQERFSGLGNAQKMGRSQYRMADRWLLERLARNGYSRQQARRVLIQASPEVLNQRPGERLQYVRRMTEKVYGKHEQQLSAAQQLEKTRERAKNTALVREQQRKEQRSTQENDVKTSKQPSKQSLEQSPQQSKPTEQAVERERGLER